jgi:hypothetical protein
MRTYQPSPRGQAPPVTWRQWLLPLGAAAGIVPLLALSPRPDAITAFVAAVDPAGSLR